MTITFGDNVRVLNTPLTEKLSLAGLIGQVYGETTPSITGVEVIGGGDQDYAIAVQFNDFPDAIWFPPDLLEFIDHAPGTEISIGDKKVERDASGNWINVSQKSIGTTKLWWQFWK